VPTTTKSIQSLFAIIMVVLGWGGWFLLKKFAPEISVGWYPYLPATFLVLGLLLTTVLEKVDKTNQRKLVNIYMLLKMSKLAVVLAFILAYYVLVKANMRLFLLVFAVYYLLYLLLEFYAFYITEKKIKQSK
jgi:hypothetical protein